jgi:hypothetical protein
MEHTECSKMSAQKIQTPGNHPTERIQHSQHGKSLKSRVNKGLSVYTTMYTLVKKTEPSTVSSSLNCQAVFAEVFQVQRMQ